MMIYSWAIGSSLSRTYNHQFKICTDWWRKESEMLWKLCGCDLINGLCICEKRLIIFYAKETTWDWPLDLRVCADDHLQLCTIQPLPFKPASASTELCNHLGRPRSLGRSGLRPLIDRVQYSDHGWRVIRNSRGRRNSLGPGNPRQARPVASGRRRPPVLVTSARRGSRGQASRLLLPNVNFFKII